MNTYPPLPRRMWNMRPWRKSPLMRAGYRVESLTGALLVALLLAAAPLAIALGAATAGHVLRQASALTAGSHRVDAVLETSANPDRVATDDDTVAPVHWTYAGHRHTGTAEVSDAARAGDHTTILVRADGTPVPAVATPAEARSDGIGVTVGVFGAALLVAAAVQRGIRHVLNRKRAQAWAAEWAGLAAVRRWNHL